MYVGPGTIEDLLKWFRETAHEDILCLFIGGSSEDNTILGSIYDVRNSLDVLSGQGIAVFFQINPLKTSELAAFKLIGNDTHILPLVSAKKGSPIVQEYNWERNQIGYKPILVDELTPDDKDAVVRSTIQFTHQVVERFNLDITNLPGLLFIPKINGKLMEPLKFSINADFNVKRFFELIKDLRQTSKSYEKFYPSKIGLGTSEILECQVIAEEKYELKIEKAVADLKSELIAFTWKSDVSQAMNNIIDSAWSEEYIPIREKLNNWAKNELASSALNAFESTTSITNLCNRIDKLFEKARLNLYYIERRIGNRGVLYEPGPKATAFDAIAEVLKKHQQLLNAASKPELASTYLVETVTSYKQPASLKPIDIPLINICVIIALREEFNEFGKLITLNSRWYEPLFSYIHTFDIPSTDNTTNKAAIICLEGMGQELAANAATKVISILQPKLVVSIGIAGGLGSDSMIGDVIIGEQIDGYLVEARAQAQRQLKFSGSVYKSTGRYVDHAINLPNAFKNEWQRLSQQSRMELRRWLERGLKSKLEREGVLRGELKMRNGHIASGPFVVAAKEVVDWLLSRDRKYIAIEMEAFGVMLAAHKGETNCLIIRGVSDLADERKNMMDDVGKGVLRRHAMRNASRVLLTMIRLSLLN